jgi:hypothetical protein
MMKKMILLVVMLTLVAFVSGVMAQPKPAPEKPATAPAPSAPAKAKEMKVEKMQKFSGAIAKVDEMGKMVEVKGKVKKEEKSMTFMINDATKITKGKETMKMADLKEGMTASIEYKKEGDKMMAATIKISAPKAPKKKEAPKK